MSYGFGIYKKTSVETASKEKILLMLYEAAIKNCKKAMESIEKNNAARKGEYIARMQDIVIELNSSLDFEVGGEVAQELSALYDFILHASSQANMNFDSRPLKDSLDILNTLYDGWKQAVASLKQPNKASLKKNTR